MTTNWLRNVIRSSRSSARLVCFPHVGGGASFFTPWADLTPSDVELMAVRYPGREDRLLEEPAVTMRELAEPIAQECAELLDQPLAFFGHSMGASVAYEVALRLQQNHGAALSGLFVSGRPGPGRDEVSRRYGEIGDAELLESIGVLGGTQAEVFENPELRELVLPAIRADYRLITRYRAPSTRLTAPIVAYYGNADPDLDEGSVAAWATVTGSSFTFRAFVGGHFYLVEHTQALLDDLFTRLKPMARPLPEERNA